MIAMPKRTRKRKQTRKRTRKKSSNTSIPKRIKIPEEARKNIRMLKEEDKELLSLKKLKKDDQRFKKQAGLLTSLLKRFKKL